MPQKNQKSLSHKFSENLYGSCVTILFLSALFIALFLAYYCLFYSYYSSVDYSLPVYLIRDNGPWNLFLFASVCIVSFLLCRSMDKAGARQRLIGYVFLEICCVVYTVLCLVWVTELPYYPSGDQLNATAAAYYIRQGNFIMFKTTGYLGKFPYQKGLTFLYEILFSLFGDFCYVTAAHMHIIMGVVTMVFGYLFVEQTSRHGICKYLYCLLLLFCAPYLILTPYTYGDLPSICFCTVLFWALLRFSRTGKIRYAVLGGIMAAFSVLVRLHTWIALIALAIGMFLVSLQKKKFVPFLAGLLIVCVSAGSIRLLDLSYAARSGYAITPGAPMILTLAMAMQDNEDGPGTYNNYQTATLSSVDYDNDAAAQIARENLRANLSRFQQDPSYALRFFKTKLLMQWIEPTFETLKSTYSFDTDRPAPEWITDLYSGDSHDTLIRFADGYQSVVYLGFLFFVLGSFRQKKRNAADFIPLIAIVGGFLFSVIWEAQCRYVLPYYIFMLLYAPDGMMIFSEYLTFLLRKPIYIMQRKTLSKYTSKEG